MDFWFLLIGKVICVGCGMIASGLFISFCINYLWKKLKDIHGFDKIYKLLREDAKRSNI